MKLTPLITLTTVALLAAATADAKLETRMQELCGKMKTCALKQAEGQDLPPEMKTMMEGMFDSMCVQWMKPYSTTLGQAGLEKKAEACIDTILAESCESLMESEGNFESKACKDFEAAADKAGVDLEKLAE